MEDKNAKLQELQILEQNIQQFFYQKQAFQMELSETEASLLEIENSTGDVFKIVGQLMIKGEKEKIIEELKNKKKIISLRVASFEKQEKLLTDKAEKLREELIK